MISGIEGEVTQGRNVAEAAKEAGASHVVYGSAGTGEPGTGIGSWESKLTVQGHMQALGLPLTVRPPVAFMELMTDRRFFPPVSTWYLMPKLMGTDRPVWWICLDDLGAIAARVFADPNRFVGADLTLATDVRSIGECRHIWTEVTGRPPRSLPMPVWIFERFVGTDPSTMWRWVRTADLQIDLAVTRDILPTGGTVRDWLARQRPTRKPLPRPSP